MVTGERISHRSRSPTPPTPPAIKEFSAIKEFGDIFAC
jgi:hypothetical protein